MINLKLTVLNNKKYVQTNQLQNKQTRKICEKYEKCKKTKMEIMFFLLLF